MRPSVAPSRAGDLDTAGETRSPASPPAFPSTRFGTERDHAFGTVPTEHVLAVHLADDLAADLHERAERLVRLIADARRFR